MSDSCISLLHLYIHSHTKFQVTTLIGTLKSPLTKILILANSKSVDRDLWIIIVLFLYIAVVFMDMNPHTKFQVPTMIGSLKSTSYKNLNLANLSRKSVDCNLWIITVRFL